MVNQNPNSNFIHCDPFLVPVFSLLHRLYIVIFIYYVLFVIIDRPFTCLPVVGPTSIEQKLILFNEIL